MTESETGARATDAPDEESTGAAPETEPEQGVDDAAGAAQHGPSAEPAAAEAAAETQVRGIPVVPAQEPAEPAEANAAEPPEAGATEVAEPADDQATEAEPEPAEPVEADAAEPPEADVTEVAEPAADEATKVEPEPAEPMDEVVAEPADPTEADATEVAEPAADGEATEVMAEPAALAAGATGGGDSPLDELEGEPPSHRGRKIALGVGIGVVVLAAAYAGAAWFVADRVPRGATVAGVEIGGLTTDDAVARLTDDLADLATEPIDVRAGDAQTTIDPAAAGLALDAQATVEALSGFSWDPRDVFRHVLGTGEEPAISTVDAAALDAALVAANDDVAIAPTEGSVVFANAEPVVTDPVDGVGLDLPATEELLVSSWLTAERPLALPTESVTPNIDDAAIEEALSTIAEPLVSAPVSVVAGEATVPLSVEQLTSVATLVPEGSRLVLELDGDALAQLLGEAAPDVGTAPQDARIELQDGAPVVVPSVNGTGIDPAALADAVAAAATSTTERTATVELSETEAEFTTADAEALGVVERISEFSTPLPPYPDPPRTENIQIGASRVTGILLMPGDTFSLLDTLSPFNAANGYHQSGVVENGFEARAYGGGLSQLSTTLFNAAFEAGLEDVTHKPHSRWFSRYPEGREATLFEGSVDMQFRNTTDHGILLQAWVAGGRTHAAIWGTPTFDVDITTGERYAFTSPRTVYNTSPECIAESGGSNGFSVQVRRVVSLDGAVARDDTYTWSYQPWNTVVCGPDPATQPDPPTPTPDPGGG